MTHISRATDRHHSDGTMEAFLPVHQKREICPDDVTDNVPDDNDDEEFRLCPHLSKEDSSGCGLAWRITTLLLCLPLCYPCYLTKKTRQHLRRQDSTPKKLTKGRCGHDHHDLSLTPNLSDSRTSLSLSSQSSLKSRSASSRRSSQELRVIFLLSRTSKKLVDSLENVQSDNREEVIGNLSSSRENINYKIVLCQEFPKRNLSQEMMMGSMNMVAIVFSEGEELQDLLATESGILSYIRQYWRGYFPLLLLQIGSSTEVVRKSGIEILERDFSSCFRLHLPDPCSRDKDVEEAVINFHLHNDKFQCHKVERATSTNTNQSLFSNNWKCSGLCGLKNKKIDPLRSKKRSIIHAIRRKISRNE